MKDAPHAIREAIKAEEKALRGAHPWLRHQDRIGALFIMVSVAGFAFVSLAYYHESIPGWLCILANVLLLSVGHEVEHDLIHQLYFPHRRLARNLLLSIGWLARGTTINPWIRSRIHRYHHQRSGQFDDAEERLIGNGMDYRAVKRWLVMFGPWFAGFQAQSLKRHGTPFGYRLMLLSLFPMIFLTTAFILYWATLKLLGGEMGLWGGSQMRLWDALMVAYVVPNGIRMIVLQFMSSTIHYFGEITRLEDQTQIFNSWYWLPLQVFCFNFGATHALHHFFPQQPFYIRQWLAPRLYDLMRRKGVRFNDIGTFRRNNRYHSLTSPNLACAKASRKILRTS